MKTKPILITLILGVAAIISFIYLSKSNESSLEPNKVVPVSIGNTIVNINIYGKQPPRIVFFNMHDNENTAVEAGKEIIQNYGGYLVELAGTGERLISFSLDDQKYTFDPNRIYTENGVKKTLERYSQYSEAAHREIRRFVDTLFQYLFIDDMKIMVALHNNTEERYSLESYMPGGSYETDASRYYKNPDSDIDDFYFITDSTFFEFFKSHNQNVALQNNEHVTDDGSLSVYCAEQNIAYINVEAQHGHLQEQVKMIGIVREYFE